MKTRFTIRKNERLKSRKIIDRLFREGATVQAYPLKLYFMVEPPSEASKAAGVQLKTDARIKFGVGISAKYFRLAVDRNRVKRLVRESFRLEKPFLREKLKGNDIELYMFFNYIGKELPDFTTIRRKMSVILDKCLAGIEKWRNGN